MILKKMPNGTIMGRPAEALAYIPPAPEEDPDTGHLCEHRCEGAWSTESTAGLAHPCWT